MPPRKGTPWSAARRAADTPAYREKLSAANAGHEPWNKGLDQGTTLPKRPASKPKAGRKAGGP